MKAPGQIALIFEVEGNALHFRLKHIGTEIVENLKVVFSSPIKGAKHQLGRRLVHKRIDRLNLFRSGIFMYPGQEFVGFVDNFMTYQERDEPMFFTTTIDYSSPTGGKQRYRLEHHLSIWVDLPISLKT